MPGQLTRTQDELLLHNRLFEFLHRTALDIMNRRDVLDLLEAIVNRASELIGATTGCVLLVSEDKTQRIRVVATGEARPYLNSRNCIEEGVAGEVWRTGQVVVQNDYQAWPQHVAEIGCVAKAVVYFPLKNNDEVVGIIGLWHTEEGKIFSPRDVEWLQQFASLASIAYTNAILHKEAQREIAERKEAEKLQRALYRISETTSSTSSLDDLYQAVHAIIGELISAKNFYIALHCEYTDTVNFPYYVDEFDDNPGPRVGRRGMTEYVIRTGQAAFIPPVVHDQLVQAGEIECIGTSSIDWLGVPLKIAGQVIGVIAVQSYTPGKRYTEKDKEILSFVSNQVAMAIERKKAEEKLLFMSMHDSLTGLYNRAWFEEELQRIVETTASSVVIAIGDVDELKLVNDTLGHSAGDEMIIAAAQIMKQALRPCDAASRIGGDEFALILPDADLAIVEEIFRRIRCAAVQYRTETGKPLSLSLGFSLLQPGKAQSAQNLIKEADYRMYRDKVTRSETVHNELSRIVNLMVADRQRGK